ncbi:MAG: hypothetical protein ACJ8J0_17460 [Longimicrobiaceae bacterium]
MIPLILWQLRWRVLVVLVICCGFYVAEPTFHVHEAADALDAVDAIPPGMIALGVANLAAASMLVLLAGFVSTDRRRGYYRIYFSHPTRPLPYYALRWLLAYALTMVVSAGFLVVGQLAAWGELRVGMDAMVQPALFALVYGGVVAFASVAFPRGDSLIALGVWLVTAFWVEFLSFFFNAGLQPPMAIAARQAVTFVLPPHTALGDINAAALAGYTAWGAMGFAGGYGLFWLAVAALLLWTREWP